MWSAIRIENGREVGEPIALKDAWVDDYRAREGTICSEILTSALSDIGRRNLQSVMPTVLLHGDVFVAGAQDETLFVTVARRRTIQTHYRVVC